MSQIASNAGSPVGPDDSFDVHGSVRSPATDAQDLVQPVGDELIADPACVVSPPGEPAFGALDAVLGERRGELLVDFFFFSSLVMVVLLVGDSAPGNGDAPSRHEAEGASPG